MRTRELTGGLALLSVSAIWVYGTMHCLHSLVG